MAREPERGHHSQLNQRCHQPQESTNVIHGTDQEGVLNHLLDRDHPDAHPAGENIELLRKRARILTP
eukprot:3569425-Pyramimonas_sp.AAC.1